MPSKLGKLHNYYWKKSGALNIAQDLIRVILQFDIQTLCSTFASTTVHFQGELLMWPSKNVSTDQSELGNL